MTREDHTDLILNSLQDLSGEVGGLRADVRNIKDSMRDLSQDVKACDGRIGNLEKKISSTSIQAAPAYRESSGAVKVAGIAWKQIGGLIVGALLGAAAVGALLKDVILN